MRGPLVLVLAGLALVASFDFGAFAQMQNGLKDSLKDAAKESSHKRDNELASLDKNLLNFSPNQQAGTGTNSHQHGIGFNGNNDGNNNANGNSAGNANGNSGNANKLMPAEKQSQQQPSQSSPSSASMPPPTGHHNVQTSNSNSNGNNGNNNAGHHSNNSSKNSTTTTTNTNDSNKNNVNNYNTIINDILVPDGASGAKPLKPSLLTGASASSGTVAAAATAAAAAAAAGAGMLPGASGAATPSLPSPSSPSQQQVQGDAAAKAKLETSALNSAVSNVANVATSALNSITSTVGNVASTAISTSGKLVGDSVLTQSIIDAMTQPSVSGGAAASSGDPQAAASQQTAASNNTQASNVVTIKAVEDSNEKLRNAREPVEKYELYMKPICENLHVLTEKQIKRVQMQLEQFGKHTDKKLCQCFRDYFHIEHEVPVVSDLDKICQARYSKNFELTSTYKSFKQCVANSWVPGLDLEIERIIANRVNCSRQHSITTNEKTNSISINRLSHDEDEMALLEEIVTQVAERELKMEAEKKLATTTSIISEPTTAIIYDSELSLSAKGNSTEQHNQQSTPVVVLQQQQPQQIEVHSNPITTTHKPAVVIATSDASSHAVLPSTAKPEKVAVTNASGPTIVIQQATTTTQKPLATTSAKPIVIKVSATTSQKPAQSKSDLASALDTGKPKSKQLADGLVSETQSQNIPVIVEQTNTNNAEGSGDNDGNKSPIGAEITALAANGLANFGNNVTVVNVEVFGSDGYDKESNSKKANDIKSVVQQITGQTQTITTTSKPSGDQFVVVTQQSTQSPTTSTATPSKIIVIQGKANSSTTTTKKPTIVVKKVRGTTKSPVTISVSTDGDAKPSSPPIAKDRKVSVVISTDSKSTTRKPSQQKPAVASVTSMSNLDEKTQKAIKDLLAQKEQSKKISIESQEQEKRMHALEHDRQMSIDPIGHTIRHQQYDQAKEQKMKALKAQLASKNVTIAI